MNKDQGLEFSGIKQALSGADQAQRGWSLVDQETFSDAEFAVETLQMISTEVPEDEVEESTIQVNVKKLRDCLELMLSLLEAYEGVNIKAMEDYQAVKDCLQVYPLDHLRVVQLQH